MTIDDNSRYLPNLGKISNSVLERVVITKLEVDKEQVVGSSSRLLPARTTDVSDQLDVQGVLTRKNFDGKALKIKLVFILVLVMRGFKIWEIRCQ